VKLSEIKDHGWIGADHKQQIEVYKVSIDPDDFLIIQKKSIVKSNSFMVRA
jgi:hypothetical protein